jgi:hypothetical protein
VEVIQKVRKSIRYYFLQRHMARRGRNKMVMGLDEAKKVGIVFDASEAADYRLIANYVKTLQDMGKKVQCLGYVQQNKLPGYLLHQVNWTFCQNKDFAWNFNMKTNLMNQFADEQLDILIDLSRSDLFYTKYISGVSNAKYKVGRFNPEQIDIFDLLMQVPDDANLQELMTHIIHYLKIIKKPESDARKI